MEEKQCGLVYDLRPPDKKEKRINRKFLCQVQVCSVKLFIYFLFLLFAVAGKTGKNIKSRLLSPCSLSVRR